MKKIPVLVTFFNRPAVLEKLFSAIRGQKDIDLFFASDGARHATDRKAIDDCWALVEKYFNKTPESHKLSRSSNLGCKKAMIGNIDWFFEMNDFGIILEDDCVPNEDFFRIVGSALVEIPANSRNISISGSDYFPDKLNSNQSKFRESIFPQVWGWGSWAKKWKEYELEIPDREVIVSSAADLLFGNRFSIQKAFFENVFNMRFLEIDSGKIDTWDYSLMATAWRLGLTSLQINGNSIVNSGFGSLATHTKNLAPDWVPRNYSNSKRNSGVMPKLDLEADRWISTNVYNCNLAEVIKNQVKKVVRK
jgi:hypothetical protein